MASLLTHAVVGATLGQAGRQQWRRKPVFWVAVIVCSVLPDLDVIGFHMGIHYGDLWGHRGLTHSLLFAAAIAAAIAVIWPGELSDRWSLGLLLFCATASHGLLDAMTNGGLGVAFFSPFETHRYFLPWRPIQVSPIGLTGMFSERAIRVLRTEIPVIWVPSLVFAFVFSGVRAWKKAGRKVESTNLRNTQGPRPIC